MAWSHYNPVRVDSGEEGLSRLGRHVPGNGEILLVTTAGFVRRGQVDGIRSALGADRVRVHAGVTPNPELDDLDRLKEEFAALSPVAIVALGGGSTIDTAKALAVILGRAEAAPLDAVLRGGRPQAWTRAIPLVAIPTTSGTGSEVTPFATVWDSRDHRKHSISGDALYPHTALLVPELTLSLPPEETLYSGLDAVSHALESLWNRNRTTLSEAHAVQALRLALDALPAVLAAPTDLAARSRMQQASLLAGMAISRTRTAIAHAISYPLTSHFGVPHGLACSFTLPRILEAYLAENEEPDHRPLLLRVGGMLDRLDLRARLGEYAARADIDALRGEMFQPGRADNYVGFADLDRFLAT
jgi:alcohol dehydrogenase